jgi:hypothetical protein
MRRIAFGDFIAKNLEFFADADASATVAFAPYKVSTAGVERQAGD